jgi:hypothetical protein
MRPSRGSFPTRPAAIAAAIALGAAAPAAAGDVSVSPGITTEALQALVQPGTRILCAPGDYYLTAAINLTTDVEIAAAAQRGTPPTFHAPDTCFAIRNPAPDAHFANVTLRGLAMKAQAGETGVTVDISLIDSSTWTLAGSLENLTIADCTIDLGPTLGILLSGRIDGYQITGNVVRQPNPLDIFQAGATAMVAVGEDGDPATGLPVGTVKNGRIEGNVFSTGTGIVLVSQGPLVASNVFEGVQPIVLDLITPVGSPAIVQDNSITASLEAMVVLGQAVVSGNRLQSANTPGFETVGIFQISEARLGFPGFPAYGGGTIAGNTIFDFTDGIIALGGLDITDNTVSIRPVRPGAFDGGNGILLEGGSIERNIVTGSYTIPVLAYGAVIRENTVRGRWTDASPSYNPSGAIDAFSSYYYGPSQVELNRIIATHCDDGTFGTVTDVESAPDPNTNIYQGCLSKLNGLRVGWDGDGNPPGLDAAAAHLPPGRARDRLLAVPLGQ